MRTNYYQVEGPGIFSTEASTSFAKLEICIVLSTTNLLLQQPLCLLFGEECNRMIAIRSRDPFEMILFLLVIAMNSLGCCPPTKGAFHARMPSTLTPYRRCGGRQDE
jgi:hypothetical protein